MGNEMRFVLLFNQAEADIVKEAVKKSRDFII